MRICEIIPNRFCITSAIVLLVHLVIVAIPTVASQPVTVTVGKNAPALEQFAAEELCGYLKKLYGIETQPDRNVSHKAEVVFLIGSPKSNPSIGEYLKPEAWPELSDQGLAIIPCRVDGKPAVIVGGGSPRATLWGIYEMVERWGVRYLLHEDVLPEKPGKLSLPSEPILMEPKFRVRQWRVVNDFACGPESWGMADYRTVLGQLAKLKFNRIFVSLWSYQPFLHLECRGITKKSATLWYGYKYPITDDMPGRQLFDHRAEFWNPDLPLGTSYEELRNAAETLVRRLMDFAKSRGMDCVITANLNDYPREFQALPGDWEPVHQLGSKSVVPGKTMSPTDPVLTELAQNVLQTTVKTYP